MKKSLVEMYALAVCFVTLICFAVALGIGIYDLVQITIPEFTINTYEYERRQSDAVFLGSPRLPRLPQERSTETPAPSDEELERRREEIYQTALASEQRLGAQSLTMISIILFINLLVFIPHWFLVRRARVVT